MHWFYVKFLCKSVYVAFMQEMYLTFCSLHKATIQGIPKYYLRRPSPNALKKLQEILERYHFVTLWQL